MNEITMTARSEVELVSNWLDAFEDALARCDRAAVDRIIADECHWRDLLAFTWNITPHDDREAVIDGLLRRQAEVHARNFRLRGESRRRRGG